VWKKVVAKWRFSVVFIFTADDSHVFKKQQKKAFYIHLQMYNKKFKRWLATEHPAELNC
jgi:hypothetical protein